MNQFKRILFIIVGAIATALGVIGILVPVLPTTPFLLIAAFFFARSSERFYQWLITNRYFGEYLRNYREGRGMPLREKLVALTALWLTIGLAVIFTIPSWWGRAALLAIAIAVTVHLVRLKTYRRPETTLAEEGQPTQELGLDSE
jgi:uncharacterized membrane protein YbaN (DUF454 family)